MINQLNTIYLYENKFNEIPFLHFEGKCRCLNIFTNNFPLHHLYSHILTLRMKKHAPVRHVNPKLARRYGYKLIIITYKVQKLNLRS